MLLSTGKFYSPPVVTVVGQADVSTVKLLALLKVASSIQVSAVKLVILLKDNTP